MSRPSDHLAFGRQALTSRASARLKIMVPRVERFIYWERRRRKCCLPEGLARTLPEAVRRKRFLALDFVFILGISLSSE